MSVFQNYNEQTAKTSSRKKKRTNLFTCVKKTVMYIRNTLGDAHFFNKIYCNGIFFSSGHHGPTKGGMNLLV